MAVVLADDYVVVVVSSSFNPPDSGGGRAHAGPTLITPVPPMAVCEVEAESEAEAEDEEIELLSVDIIVCVSAICWPSKSARLFTCLSTWRPSNCMMIARRSNDARQRWRSQTSTRPTERRIGGRMMAPTEENGR